MKNSLLPLMMLVFSHTVKAGELAENKEESKENSSQVINEKDVESKKEVKIAKLLNSHGRHLQYGVFRKKYLLRDNNLFKEFDKPEIIADEYGFLIERDFSGQQITRVEVISEKKRQEKKEMERHNERRGR